VQFKNKKRDLSSYLRDIRLLRSDLSHVSLGRVFDPHPAYRQHSDDAARGRVMWRQWELGSSSTYSRIIFVRLRGTLERNPGNRASADRSLP
jgi:hypothetical protein